MKTKLYVLTIIMAILFGVLLAFAMQLDIRSWDFIDHILPTRPTVDLGEDDDSRPKIDFTIPTETEPPETTRPNSGTRPRPTTPPETTDTTTVPEESEDSGLVTLPETEPSTGGREDEWETPEF